MESKICKTCQVEKTLPEFKPHRRVCRECASKLNYEKYKNLFKEYIVKDQEKGIEYQKVYWKKFLKVRIRNLLEDQEQLM